MDQYLQFLTREFTALGITFQIWMLLVAVILILWVGAIASKI